MQNSHSHKNGPEQLDQVMYFAHPDMDVIKDIQIGDMIHTVEPVLSENEWKVETERFGVVTAVQKDSDGVLKSVFSVEVYPSKDSLDPVHSGEDWVLSKSYKAHSLSDLENSLFVDHCVSSIRKRVVEPDFAAADLRNSDTRAAFERSLNCRMQMVGNKYFVYNEDTLGYTRPESSEPAYFASPHHLFCLAGAQYGQSSTAIHLLDADIRASIRPATVSDFEKYRVSLPPDFYSEQNYVRRDELKRPEQISRYQDDELVHFIRECRSILRNQHRHFHADDEHDARLLMLNFAEECGELDAPKTGQWVGLMRNYADYYALYGRSDVATVLDIADSVQTGVNRSMLPQNTDASDGAKNGHRVKP